MTAPPSLVGFSQAVCLKDSDAPHRLDFFRDFMEPHWVTAPSR
jgi:hypothetical protein